MKKENLLSKDEITEIQQLGIEQKDERNILLSNTAKARAYELIMWLYSITIVVLAIFDIINILTFFILLGIFIICQIYFIIRLKRYHKEM